MREILFRGKCKTDNEWLYGFPYVTRKNAVKINWYCSEFGSMRTDEVDPETVGQYTGLTDKNCKKIFEGDLIRSTEAGETAIVQWFSEHSAFMIWCKTSNQVGFLYECEKSIIEVIGNIHDNPELVGGEENA